MSATTVEFSAALQSLCASQWAPYGVHIASQQSESVLKALLPASRSDEGRATLGQTPNAIENILSVLLDPPVIHERLGVLAIRLLRNICARSTENQTRAAQCRAHQVVLDCIKNRLNATEAQSDNVEPESRFRLPFFGFAVEFLVNFATGNATNADLVWDQAFPSLLESLLECDNLAASSAAAALLHNCIAIVPDRMKDVVQIWSGKDGQRSLARSLVKQMTNTKDSVDPNEEEKFSWSFMVIRRLIGASFLSKAFEALGPTLDDILKSSSEQFSSSQITLLQILEAAANMSAENPTESDVMDISIPEDSLDFFVELIEAALFRKSGDVLQIGGSIIGSVIILSRDSVQLNKLRMKSVKVAVNVLQAIAGYTNSDENNEVVESLALTDDPSFSHIRGVMVRVVAICCDQCTPAQDAVRKLQGIPFILNALSYEKDATKNPFLREWAVMAIRNLTLGNTANAAEISSYELVGLQNDTELLEKTGLEPYLDPESGKPKLRVRGSGPS